MSVSFEILFSSKFFNTAFVTQETVSRLTGMATTTYPPYWSIFASFYDLNARCSGVLLWTRNMLPLLMHWVSVIWLEFDDTRKKSFVRLNNCVNGISLVVFSSMTMGSKDPLTVKPICFRESWLLGNHSFCLRQWRLHKTNGRSWSCSGQAQRIGEFWSVF